MRTRASGYFLLQNPDILVIYLNMMNHMIQLEVKVAS